MTGAPVRYDPALEHVAPDEAETREALIATMRSIAETTWRDYGQAVRSVHAKSHALLEGELQVFDGLPAELAQGLFARPGTYPVVMRLSTNPGDVLDDAVSAPRGLAIKVIGVEWGERLPRSEGDATQDFVLANGPAFVAPDAKGFLGSLKLLAATTDRGNAPRWRCPRRCGVWIPRWSGSGCRSRRSRRWAASRSRTRSARASTARCRCATATTWPRSW